MLNQGYHIIVVDDSPLIAERICEILRELECITSIDKATNFTEASDLLALHEYDVAILDINLPGKNGIELLSYVKSTYPRIKIMMVSNQSDDYYRNLCHSLGSDTFIDKSSEFENIPDTITSYYETHIGLNH